MDVRRLVAAFVEIRVQGGRKIMLVYPDELERYEKSKFPAEFLVIDFHCLMFIGTESSDLFELVGGEMDAVLPALALGCQQGADAVHLEVVVSAVSRV